MNEIPESIRKELATLAAKPEHDNRLFRLIDRYRYPHHYGYR
ncbi:MAG TPA: hypothetical protein P5260_15010 [Candidatus Competibacter sp.]|nr:hypothetical protein [Candidatus Competibacter sp.]